MVDGRVGGEWVRLADSLSLSLSLTPLSPSLTDWVDQTKSAERALNTTTLHQPTHKYGNKEMHRCIQMRDVIEGA